MRIKGFLSLLEKYRKGTLPEEKKKVMDAWYDSFGKDTVEEENPEIKSRIWKAVLKRTEKTDEFSKFRSNRFLRYTGWAAAFGAIMLFGWIYYRMPAETLTSLGSNIEGTNAEANWKFIENRQDTKIQTQLPDGSKVVLEPGSSLKYPPAFSADERTVHMHGKAFFDVVKEQGRPFLVHAGELVVRVLGTSFTISELDGAAATEIAVMTGRVVVEKTIKNDRKPAELESKMVLTPNNKITFFKDTGHYIAGLVNKPLIIEKTEEFVNPEAFDFDEVPLRQIISKMEKAYGVSIGTSKEATLDCVITADLSSDNLYGSLELICAVLNGTYEVVGNSILLSGGVCNDWKKSE